VQSDGLGTFFAAMCHCAFLLPRDTYRAVNSATWQRRMSRWSADEAVRLLPVSQTLRPPPFRQIPVSKQPGGGPSSQRGFRLLARAVVLGVLMYSSEYLVCARETSAWGSLCWYAATVHGAPCQVCAVTRAQPDLSSVRASSVSWASQGVPRAVVGMLGGGQQLVTAGWRPQCHLIDCAPGIWPPFVFERGLRQS